MAAFDFVCMKPVISEKVKFSSLIALKIICSPGSIPLLKAAGLQGFSPTRFKTQLSVSIYFSAS
jgi:hypothetical protein